MNNVSMGGMNAMGGPVGGGMPMMNNGAAGVRQPMPANDNRSQLNTYIYEYFLRNGMYDCARSLLNSDQPMNVIKDSPGRRRDENGGDEGADGDSKDDIDSKRPADLPEPNLPKECPESCFLYEWWCLFWDMFNAQRGKGDGRNVLQYVTHTQVRTVMAFLVKFKLRPSQGTITDEARTAASNAPGHSGRHATTSRVSASYDDEGSSSKQYESQPEQ
jgi:hypothetical protein